MVKVRRPSSYAYDDIDPFPLVWAKEEFGGPTAAERARIVRNWYRRAERHERREAGRQAQRKALRCGLCSEPIGDWFATWVPVAAPFCRSCHDRVPIHYPRFSGERMTGLPRGLPPGFSNAMRACTVALYHLEHLESSHG